jgi:NADPH2:quinone reductase
MGFPHMKYRRIIVNRERHLELVEEDLPNPGRGEVRVKILAAGVSFADVSMREGIHRRKVVITLWVMQVVTRSVASA